MATVHDAILVGSASSALPVVTTAQAKLHLRVDHADEDELIAQLVAAATDLVEQRSRRQLVTTTRRVELDCFPSMGDDDQGRIVLPHPPLIAVSSVTYVDATGATVTLAADQYAVVVGGEHGGRGWIVPAYGAWSWPAARTQPGSVRITYTCGYGAAASAVPAALRQAVLLLVAHWYEQRSAVIVGTIAAELPMAVASLIGSRAAPECV